MKKVLVIGSFGYFNNQVEGQTVKTRQVYELLKERYDGRVDFFCTLELKKKPYLIFAMLYKIITCSTLIALYSSSGGVQTLVPKLYKITKLFSKHMIYIAIGSTQVNLMEGTGEYSGKGRREDVIDSCRNMYAFLSETRKVERELKERLGFKNVDFFPNFRYFDEDLPFVPASTETLRIVFMARISLSKGFDVVYKFLDYIKDKNLNISVDFYGPLYEAADTEEFYKLLEAHKEQNVRYLGTLQPDEIHKTLLNYDLMVLPTLVEGIPGSVIDGYIASLPIIATNWVYASEIIEDGVNGFIVPMENPEKQNQFNERILQLYKDRELLNKMKQNAFKSRKQYSAQAAWDAIKEYL